MKPMEFDFTKQKPSKTLDIGLNGTNVSADPFGRMLQLSTFHPEHGIIVAAPYEQFDGSRFYEPQYVRAYRARMLKMIRSGKPGFGVRFDRNSHQVAIEICDISTAIFKYHLHEHVTVTMTLKIDETGSVIQHAIISSTSSEPMQIPYIWDLGISINRASYGQLTEGGPIPIPPLENDFQILDQGDRYAIVNKHLNSHLEGSLWIDGTAVKMAKPMNETFVGRPVSISYSRMIEVPANSSRTILANFHLYPDVNVREGREAVPNRQIPPSLSSQSWTPLESDALFIIRRNLDYFLGNCTFPVSETEVAVITDHVALPLGWNRDNYWQIRFSLDIHQNAGRLMDAVTAKRYQTMIHRTVKGHLNWVFRRAQRPHIFWHRSYLITGRPKDGPVFQLDQQCYPLLELCDFYDAFPEEATFAKDICMEKTLSDIITLLKSKRDPSTGLFPTDETPGDDAVEFPFHFSSHVLLWHTFSRLHRLLDTIGLKSISSRLDLNEVAQDIRRLTIHHFQTTNNQTGRSLFAYLTNGVDKATLYHDANDIPTLFAPAWNFVHTEEEYQLWKNTMEFGLSQNNEKGYFVGEPFGGLGSVHTPGPWPLGYFQEFVYAQLTNSSEKEQDAWRRIKGAMQWDGLFPEAVDYRTGECTSKAWFSWPGSMIGGALVRSKLI
ncbi:uncharacterized protein PV09_08632 [Verruconis gallopava]|uniref:Uncharacterized protein n=1 Tax=Verruconis gallopava TaxID=253628 RepID=A0A0D2A057_9PEZI|nr:uncharacterized protein PV09_08632 [Verruconis gallopava]KIV99699.1 hypothetical protein PV09_08632 [Verruconis gallopava]